MSREYNDYSSIKKKIDKNLPLYWVKVFGIVNQGEVVLPNGIRVSKDNRSEVKKLKQTIEKWENEIYRYHDEFKEFFDLDLFDDNNDERYEYQEFKDIFATKLWTVRGALRTPDPDLDLYKSKFHQTTGAEIFYAIQNILLATHEQISTKTDKINYKYIKSVTDLQLDYLDEDNMFLPGIIGLGIRSELLHRIYPSYFSIMTRRSGWAMYYLTDECDEFVIDEENDGKHRTSFYWEYDYDRFSFYCNYICNLLEQNLEKYGIKLNPKFRFGYVNLFLNEIFIEHKKQAEYLNKWKLVSAY